MSIFKRCRTVFHLSSLISRNSVIRSCWSCPEERPKLFDCIQRISRVFHPSRRTSALPQNRDLGVVLVWCLPANPSTFQVANLLQGPSFPFLYTHPSAFLIKKYFEIDCKTWTSHFEIGASKTMYRFLLSRLSFNGWISWSSALICKTQTYHSVSLSAVSFLSA